MATKLILVFYQFAIICRQFNCTKVEGYYWRDYTGRTPIDALPAGMDYSGNPIYIGQTCAKSRLIIGKIYLNDPYLYFEYGGVNKKIDFVKILCTQSPKDFVWVRTRQSESYPSNLVIGGFEPDDEITYIGRVFYKLETFVGKVVGHRLFAVSHREDFQHIQAYEILTYQPRKNKKIG